MSILDSDALLGTCKINQVLLAGVPVLFFSQDTLILSPPTDIGCLIRAE